MGDEPAWPGPREMATAIRSSIEKLKPHSADPSPAAALARILAQTISETFNAVIPLVAPRLYARWTDASRDDLLSLRDACVALLDKLVLVVGDTSAPTPQLPFAIPTSAVGALRSALNAWDGRLPPPASLRDAAQDLLTSSGLPLPPGGWAAFDVPPSGD